MPSYAERLAEFNRITGRLRRCNKPHDVEVHDFGDGTTYMRCIQSKLHETVPSERLRSAIDRLDDVCETEHHEV